MKHEKLVVEVEGFKVSEIDPMTSAQLRDDIEARHKGGKTTLLVTITREFFKKRVSAWPYKEDCDDANKEAFFLSYPERAGEILSAAEDAIKEKRDELLKNL